MKAKSGMWRITSEQGVEFGEYPGKSVADALDALARDAGYASQETCMQAVGPFKGHVVYVRPIEVAS